MTPPSHAPGAARALFDQGRLADAIETQNEVVKANPTDVDARHELSVYLCFAGNLDRAFLQLNTLGKQDPELVTASNVYRSLLIADLQRRKVFHEDARPLLPPDCPPQTEARLDALLAMRRGDAAAADAALDRAVAAEGNRGGKLNGEAFAGIRDSDDLLGSVLEIYAGETYLWMPIEHVRKLEIRKPSHLLDLLWVPAQIEDLNGNEASVHLPTLYEGSHEAAEDALRTGRKTEWREVPGVGSCGVGQKLLLTAGGGEGDDAFRETGLLEVRLLEFASEADGG